MTNYNFSITWCQGVYYLLSRDNYNILFRKKLYSNLEDLQIDVDEWIRKYNYERPHSGKYCYGKTPYQTFLESKHIAIEKTIDENSKINDDKKEISDSLNCQNFYYQKL